MTSSHVSYASYFSFTCSFFGPTCLYSAANVLPLFAPRCPYGRMCPSRLLNPDRSRKATRSIMDPFSLSTGIVGLIAVALKLVVGALGMIDKTVVAYNEAADELKGLQQDLEQLQTQIIRIHGMLKVLASNTKDQGFKKLLQE